MTRPSSSGTSAKLYWRSPRQGKGARNNKALDAVTTDGVDVPFPLSADVPEPSPFEDPFGDFAPQGTPSGAASTSRPLGDRDRGAQPATPAPLHVSQRQRARPIGMPSPPDRNARDRRLTGQPSGGWVKLAQSEQGQPEPAEPADDGDATIPDLDDLDTFPLEPDLDGPALPSQDELTPDGLADPMESRADDEQTRREDLLPAPPGAWDQAPTGRATTCARIYNKRDCCEEDDQCQTALELLGVNTISTISLDISPPYEPQPVAGSDPEAQAKDLAEASARTWRDRKGGVLAEGRFVDYRQGQVYIRSTDGTTTPIPYRNLGDDELCFINAWWFIPAECRMADVELAPRNWQLTTFTWKASGLCHKPLYFEQEQLERYGHSAGPIREPLVSAASFFVDLCLLPYSMGVHPPNECIYALGHYRVGSCAPWLVPAFPLSLRGAACQAGFVAALVTLP